MALVVGLLVGLTGLAAADTDGVQVIATGPTGVTVDVSAPNFEETEALGPDGRAYVRLTVPGFVSGAAAGLPDLPQRSFLVAVPPGAELGISVEALAERSVWLAADVYPAGADGVERKDEGGRMKDEDGRYDFHPSSFIPHPSSLILPSADATPATLGVIEEIGYLRDVRLARVTVFPLQYTPATGLLRHVQQMRVRVTFSLQPSALILPSADGDPGEFDAMLEHLVINPEALTSGRANPAAPVFRPAAFSAGQSRYRITLREAGTYQLTYRDLQTAGVPVATLDPRRLRMVVGDEEMAIEVVGEADGRFDPGDVIRFYATKVNSLYTETNVVWLAVGDANGRRMTARSVAPQGGAVTAAFSNTVRFEENRTYRSAMPLASDVDHWYWGQMYVLTYSSVLTLTLPFTIEHPLPAGPASLRLDLWGASYDPRVNPDHHVVVYINGTPVGDARWSGAVQTTPVLTFDQALLHDGANTLVLYSPGDTGARDVNNQRYEVTWLNFFDVTYARSFQVVGDRLAFTPAAGSSEFSLAPWSTADVLLYDVTTPLAPVRLTGAVVAGAASSLTINLRDTAPPAAAYYATGSGALLAPLAITARQVVPDLRAPAVGADYLIISHADFLAGIEALAQFRRSQGLHVRVVDVQDIYDEFGGGLLDPHAIRDFIQYAYFNWPSPAPAYVLLAGNGTYDFMNREGTSTRMYIPPFLANADPILGETGADNRYVTVVGDDLVPDLHLGRLPLTSQADLTAMVDKIISYEANPAGGSWRTKAVFVADNADNAGAFGDLSNSAAAYLPPEFTTQKIYLGSAQYPLGNAARAQQATVEAFNSGALFFNYVGHSSIGNWAGELLFGLNSLPQVNNGNRYPIMLPMTCLEGSYFNPRFASLSASIVRLNGRGAVASWAPTGLGIASGHDYLHQGFYDAVFNWGAQLLGPATLAGKLNLYVNGRFSDGTPRFHDLLDTYVLLGDPATAIGMPKAQLSVTAAGPTGQLALGDLATYTVEFGNAGPARAAGVVITTALPAGLTDLAWSSTMPSLTVRPGLPLRFDLPGLAAGETGRLVITGAVGWNITAASLPFSAEISIGSRWPESDYSDNRSGPLVANLLPADLRIKQAIQPGVTLAPGDYVTFTLAYFNDGPGSAGGISLTLPVPVQLENEQVLQSGAALTRRTDQLYAWDVAPLRPGDAGRLIIGGRVPHFVSPQNATWSVAGQISTAWLDADLSNNRVEPVRMTITISDMFEPDNTMSQAHRADIPLAPERHRYEFPDDQDWVVFRTTAGMSYRIRTLNLGVGGDTVLSLWNQIGMLLVKNDDYVSGSRASQIIWTAPKTGDYYLMITAYSASTGFSYDLEILPVGRSFLPKVGNS